MIDDNKFKEDLLASLSDEAVPNKANKIKAIYSDRIAQQNKPLFKYRRLYFIGVPALCAAVAVSIIIPVISKVKEPQPQYIHIGDNEVVEKVENLGSDNQLSMAFTFLGNAAKTIQNNELPTEVIGNSSFTTIKDLYILNSYMYTFENYLANGFDQVYSIDYNEDNAYKYSMNYMDSNIYTEFNEIFKSTYNGEQNYSFDGLLKYKDNEDIYTISGEKSGLFGVYSSTNKLIIDDESNKGFNVGFSSDILGVQEIHIQEFKGTETLSDIVVSCYSKTLKDKTSYYVEAIFDGYTFTIERLNEFAMNINIDTKSTSDSILVTIVEEDGSTKYDYSNPNLNIDFSLPRN